MSIFCEMPGIARSSSEKRFICPPNRLNKITSVHLPSTNLNALSASVAAVIAVYCLRCILFCKYPTFLCVLE